jgi:hypothetical protein
MAGPWEQYQQQETGPWTKYQAPSKQAEPAPLPKEDTWAKVGSYIPEAATTPLSWLQKHYVQPMERWVQTAGDIGAETYPRMLRNAAPESGILGPQRPEAKGIAAGIGRAAGSMVADPRNWPLMGSSMARPLLRQAMTLGFTAQLGHGAITGAKDLHDNWDKYSPQERAEKATTTGVDVIFAAGSAAHMMGEPQAAPHDIAIELAKRDLRAGTPADHTPQSEAAIQRAAEEKVATQEAIANAPKDIAKRVAQGAIRTAQKLPAAVSGTPPSQSTGSDLKAKIAQLRADIEAAETRAMTPAERVQEIAKKSEGTFFGPQAARDLPGAEDKSKYPAQAGKGVEVPGVVDAKEAAKQAAKPVELPKAPEARTEPPPTKQPIQSKSYSGWQLVEGRKPEKAKASMPTWEKPAGLDITGPEAVAAAEARAALVEAQRKTISEAESKRGGPALPAVQKLESGSDYGSTERPKVGRQVTPPETSQPASKPVPTTEAPAKGGEPVRSAEKAPLSEPRSLRGDLGERPPVAKVLNPLERLAIQRERIQKYVEEHPGVSKQHAATIVAEQMRKEQGSLGGGEPRDPEGRRADREAKINEWINTIKDPKAKQGDLENAYKMLRAYGLEPDEIIQRAAGETKGFAKTGKDIETHDDFYNAIGKGRPERGPIRDVLKAKGWTNPSRITRGGLEGSEKWVGPDGHTLWLDFDHEGLLSNSKFTKPEGMKHVPPPRDPNKPQYGSLEDMWNLEVHLDGAIGEFKDHLQDRLDKHIHAWFDAHPGATAEDLQRQFKEYQETHPAPKKEGLYPKGSSLEGFEDRGDRLPEPSKEALEERIGSQAEIRSDIDAWAKEQEAIITRRPTAEEHLGLTSWAEGKRVGAEDVTGVKNPTTEWLEQQAALKDPRKAEREDERGSLSFKRISAAAKAAANPVTRLADALDRLASFIEHPRLSDTEAATEQTARNIMRKAFAEKDRSHAEVMKALEDHIERHDNPVNERQNFIDFMDAAESGAQNLSASARQAYIAGGGVVIPPADQAIATVLRDMFDERWDKIKAAKGLEGDGIENYMSHMWERPNKAFKALNGVLTGRKPLEGPAKFMKTRFYQYASMGVDKGLVPVSWNPIRLQLQSLFDMDRFIMAHEIKNEFKDAGLAKWVNLKDYKNVPPGWARLNDKIFQPRPLEGGSLNEYGVYYAPTEVARIFNRYLEPGLGGNPVFKSFRNYGNRLNMISLGISGYHGTMITLVSATSDLALGLQKVANYGDYSGGIKDMLRGTVGTFIVRSAARDYKLGRAIQAEALEPTGNPMLQKYVDAITKGGGGFQQDSFYTNSLSNRKGFVNWLKLGVTGHPFQMIDKAIRTLSSPIMEKYVPRVKLGAAAHMMEAKLAALDKAGVTDPNAIATELGKIWDSIDNRAGQMRYNNLFWNNMAKDLAFVSVRAVGWDLGSIREYAGGATIDAPRQIANMLRGNRPELTHRLAFTIATPLTVGLVGGMLHLIMTGKVPQKTEDYFYPGPDGAKVSFPSYMKDYFAFKEHPLKTAVNKLHPTLGQMVDFYHNSDFYGTEIYHPGDDKFKKGWDILKWYSKSYIPLSFKGIATRIERGESVGSAVSGYAGFMPAPSSVGQTRAESLAYDLATREWKQGPRTSAAAERFHLVQKFEHQVGLGQWNDQSQAEMIQAWKDRRIQDSDIATIFSNYNTPKLQREFKKLELPDALAVMREANPDERVQLKPFLLQKYGTLERYPLDQQQAYDREIRAFLQ